MANLLDGVRNFFGMPSVTKSTPPLRLAGTNPEVNKTLEAVFRSGIVDPNKYLAAINQGGRNALDLTRGYNEESRSNLERSIPLFGAVQGVRTDARIKENTAVTDNTIRLNEALFDKQTQQALAVMGPRAQLIRDLAGGSDMDKFKLALDYASSNQQQNRDLVAKAMNQDLLTKGIAGAGALASLFF